MTRRQGYPDSHSDHDQVLVAAFVAGDLDGSDAEAARDLISGCRACAELAADIGAMTAAVRALPPPSRPRDFRISAEQASALQRRGIRRFLPAGDRGLGFARPLGSGLAALGVAGLLFTSLLGSQVAVILSNVGSPVSGGAQDYRAPAVPEAASTNRADTASKGATPAPSAAASAAASAVPSTPASPVAVPSAAASAAAASSATAGDGSGNSAASTPPGPLPSQPSPTSAAPDLLPVTPLPATGTPAAGMSTGGAGTPSQGDVPLLPAVSVAALLAGLGLLGADLVARRR